MSVQPTPRLGRAVRYFTPVVLTASLAVPMLAATDSPDGNPGHGGTPPGHGGEHPGHGGTPPGHGGTPPGHAEEKPGNGPQRESSSTTVIVERVSAPAPAVPHSEPSTGLTPKPVVKRRCVSRRVIRIRLDRHYRIRSARRGRRAGREGPPHPPGRVPAG